MADVVQFLGMLFVGLAVIVTTVFAFAEHFAAAFIAFLIAGTAFAIYMHRRHDGETRTDNGYVASKGMAAQPAQSEIRTETSPQGEKQGERRMTTTTSPSNHRLAGHTGAFLGVVSFILDALTAIGLFYLLVGWYVLPGPGFAFLGLNYPWELAIAASAVGYYWLSGIFSVRRERSRFWADVDLAGVSIIALVLFVAALSVYQPTAALFKNNGLPSVSYNTITMTTLIGFGAAVLRYFWRYHIQRAEVGLEGIQRREGEAAPARKVVEGQEIDLAGGKISFDGATLNNCIFTDSNHRVRLTSEPQLIEGSAH